MYNRVLNLALSQGYRIMHNNKTIILWKGSYETSYTFPGIWHKTFPTAHNYRRVIRWLIIQKVYKKNG